MYFFQELNDIKKSGIKVYRVSPIDEANMLNWQGLIMPVSCQNHFTPVSKLLGGNGAYFIMFESF